MCDHSGFWSCLSSYDRPNQRLRYRMVCDRCGDEMRQLGDERYVPRPLVDTDSPTVCEPPVAA